MKHILTLLIVCWFSMGTQQNENPFFNEWNTPFETPPFNEIKSEHFLPAIEEGIRLEKAEIDAIVNNKEEPTFENTIVALEKSGKSLSKVNRIFGMLNGANTNEELQAISRKTTPMLTKHYNDINLNDKLFERIKILWDKKESLGLNTEENKLLKLNYEGFVRSGANLGDEAKDEMRKINEELSMLGLKFRENHLAETNKIGLIIDNEEDLTGLNEDIINAAAEAGNVKGYEGKWVFTLQKPSWIPFLQYSEKRDLREKLFTAYVNRGNNDDEYDNKEIIAKMAALRVKRGNLLGYERYADFILERNMAKTAETVYKFLDDLWTPSIKKAKQEVADMQTIIDEEGGNFKLEPWDWWYYAEKVKKAKYDLDEEELRPYFKMENVLAGAFEVATKLYGIKFIERPDVQVYHPDVVAFEVQEKDGTHLGVFYGDYYPRDGKRAGAWSSSLRSQSNIDGEFITPINYNVGNFAKPTADKPSLMSLDEVLTLFHELGHGLNSLFANTTYAGSRYFARDFVELPSQIMEHWAMEPVVLKSYAKHYLTGEPIPDELIQKIVNAGHFNKGFEFVEYLAASYLDMDWHTLTDTEVRNTAEFDEAAFKRIGLIPEIESRYQSTNFGHIIGGYIAGYYSYRWAEVLDCDAFEAFKESGDLFNPELAAKFRKHVLSGAGEGEPMDWYVAFRGKKPTIDALLKKRGLN
ncbi:M3 family metallopeptidase [Bacteroidota bacterium]